MSEQEQAVWAIQALQKLRTTDNQVVIDSVIKVLEDQQAEIMLSKACNGSKLLYNACGDDYW